MTKSEEIMHLNKALRYCSQLKVNLQTTLLHVQMLNTKYNTNVECESKYTLGIITLTPKKTTIPKRLKMECRTPGKLNRSLQEIKQTNNNIIVRGIKVRRDVETAVNQLNRIRETHRKEQIKISKRRLLYFNDNNAATTPVRCSHINCQRTYSPISVISPNYYGTSTPIYRRRIIDRLKSYSPQTC